MESDDNTVSGMAKGACRACGDVHNVLAHPLVGGVDTIHLFLTLGVVLVSMIIWSRVLAHIKIGGV